MRYADFTEEMRNDIKGAVRPDGMTKEMVTNKDKKMDYSVKGILMMLQDLQRDYFGKATIFVQSHIIDFNEERHNSLTCAIFRGDELLSVNFNDFADDESDRKENYIKVREYLKKIK